VSGIWFDTLQAPSSTSGPLCELDLVGAAVAEVGAIEALVESRNYPVGLLDLGHKPTAVSLGGVAKSKPSISVECPEQTQNRHHLRAHRSGSRNSFNVRVLGEIER
jgi:hypothetical protein